MQVEAGITLVVDGLVLPKRGTGAGDDFIYAVEKLLPVKQDDITRVQTDLFFLGGGRGGGKK